MNELLAHFSRFNRREQTTMLVGGIAVLLYIFWIAVLSPLQAQRDNQVLANATTTQSLGRVQMLAAQILQARNQGALASAGSENISRLIDASLQANGLTMSGFQPGTAGEVRVRLDRAPFESLLQWLYDVEFKHNIVVRDLSIASTNDPGQVTVNIRMQKL
jgi:general secretion pathway protein M